MLNRAVVLFLMCVVADATGQTYPSKPVRVVVVFAARSR